VCAVSAMVEVETRFRWHEAGGPDDGYSIEAREIGIGAAVAR
jgi:hypothetical protein